AGLRVDPAQTPPPPLETASTPVLPRRLVAEHQRGDAVQSDSGQHHPIPLSGNRDPLTLATHGMTNHPRNGVCGEPDAVKVARPVREAGQGDGSKIDTAPRLDLTSTPCEAAGTATRSPLGMQDLHSLQHVSDNMIRAVIPGGPYTSIDPDRTQPGRVPAFDVGNKVVADHPSSVCESRAAPLGSDLKQADGWLTDALDA
ncbi:MAG: hypothetical protein JWQ95_5526, partial [Sphaerisporangium sp.]|nr:hypothetical protein [Sphaerisporangium sp.]